MSTPPPAEHPRRFAPGAPEGLPDRDARADQGDGRYLTDGVRLFRRVGSFGEAAGLIGLEDCRSLDVVLLRAQEARSLRPVRQHGLSV